MFSGGGRPLTEPFLLCIPNPRKEIALSSTVSLADSGLVDSELLVVEFNDATPTLLESLGIEDKVNSQEKPVSSKMHDYVFLYSVI